MIVPVYVLVTPLSILVGMVFDRKSVGKDIKALRQRFSRKKTNA